MTQMQPESNRSRFSENWKPFFALMVSTGTLSVVACAFADNEILPWALVGGVLAFAFLPFVLVFTVLLCGALLLLPFFLIAAAWGDFDIGDVFGFDTPDLIGSGFQLYYGTLGQLFPPWFWGLPTGCLLGASAFLFLHHGSIERKRTETQAYLRQIESNLDAHYREHGIYPWPSPGEKLDLTTLGMHVEGENHFAVDAFDRPLFYRVVQVEPKPEPPPKPEPKGFWASLKRKAEKKLAKKPEPPPKPAFELRSHGYDRYSRSDDIVIERNMEEPPESSIEITFPFGGESP
ncbi:hypothetical protein SCOR_00440 [Sulfidibacter corallicola]|uniref:Uncharacterized protein n=1 Tax=Sulfidibacter corallicola TaxID=2818388 RepID=A0A8A4TR57_SULCO|nr:hypothetical protein [Sulfidibacter corallicola]QTD49005.1 hypothetical protein J3U87_25755 [Sulfidibacter corallicola]